MENQQHKKALLITAHPDDDTLTGGTIATLARAGWSIDEFVCTPGKNGKNNLGENQGTVLDNRADELSRFAASVGMNPPILYHGESPFLSLHDEIVIELVRRMREIRPDLVILLNAADYHFEHVASHEIGLRALEISCRSSMLNLGPKLASPVILETDGLNVMNNPLVTFRIDEVAELKEKACIDAYGERLGSEILGFDQGLSRMRGARVGFREAEAYALLNPRWYKFTADAARTLAEFVALGS